MKKTHILATLLALLTLAGCEKVDDGVDGMVEIFAESMSGGKVLLNGANSTWVSGDQIRLNGTTATVTRRDGHAYISSDGLADVNRAVYPASLVGSSLTSNTVAIEFPRYYHYRTDGNGHQVLDLPMAAYSDNSTSPLQFKHLTGALYITITNTASVPLTLQSVTVTSSNYQLSGTRNIDISTMSIEGSGYSSVDDKSVSLVFDENLTLGAGSNARVMVPVLPVGRNQKFTIKVRSVGENIANTYMYSRSQTSGGDHSLQRNQLGYVPVSITAEESSSPLDQVNGAYVVRTPLEFCLMAQGITNSSIADNATIEIMEDINMSGYPISSIDKASFAGTINGNSHKIDSLHVNSVAEAGNTSYFCALFGKVAAATINDLTILNLVLQHQGAARASVKFGGLVGISEPYESATLVIDNCEVFISSVNVNSEVSVIYFGGLVGNANALSITRCNAASMYPLAFSGANTIYYGGLIGSAGGARTSIASSSWRGVGESVTPAKGSRIGGLIGNKADGYVTARSCSISDTVSVTGGSYNYCGTLFGYYAGDDTKITEEGNNLDFKVSFNGNPVAIGRYNTSLTNN